MSNPALSPIYERLNGAGGYHPFTANTFTDWSSEAGDTVTISRNGTEYAAPIHKQTITWRGQPRVTMETSGNREREPTERVSDRKFKSTKSAARTNSGKTYTFEANDQHFLYEIDNPTTGIKTRLQVAENDITAEVTRATTAEGGIRTDVASLQVTIDGITQTVGTIEDEVDTLDGKVTTIEGSALWTQRDNITGVVGEFDVVTDAQTGTKTLVVKSGGGLNIRRNGAEFGVYDDGTLTAGVIATKVNGVASTNIYGSNIVMSATNNTPVNVVIAGKLSAEDITANFLNAKIAQIPNLSVQNILATGSIECEEISTDFISSESVRGVEDINALPFDDFIVDASVSGNTLTLTKADGNTVTFSKATTLSDAWGSGTITVTASPQGNTLVRTLSAGEITWDGNMGSIPINAVWGSGGQYSESTGWSVTVNATPRFNAGWDYGITQRYVTAETAGSSEIPIKTLAYDEKWKVIFGIPNSSGVDQFSSYVVKAPSSAQPATVDVVAGEWITALYPSTGRASITLSPSSGGGESRTVVITSGSMNGTTDGYVEICAIAAVDDATLLPVRSYQARITFDAWSNNKATVHLKTHGGTGSSMCSRVIDASSLVTATGLSLDAAHHTVSRVANSSTKEYTVSVSVGGWSNGNATVAAVLGTTQMQTATVSIPAASSWSASYIGIQAGDPKMSVSVNIGGASRTGTVSASGAYNAGVTAGENKYTAGPKLKYWGNGLLFQNINGTYVPVVNANWYHDLNGTTQYYTKS